MSYARWATKNEVAKRLKEINLKDEIDQSGTPMGYNKNNLLIDSQEAHNLVIGSTGSGKTQSIILPLLRMSLKANESVIITDPKGEIYKKISNKFRESNYNVVLIDFDDAKYGNCWNPFKLAYDFYKEKEYDKALKEIEDFSYYIFYEKNENGDPFWNNSVMDYFTGLTLYLFENAEENEINLDSIVSLSNYISSLSDINLFLDKIDRSSSMYINLVGTLSAPNETRGSIISVFNQKIKKYISHHCLSTMLSSSDFDIKNIDNIPTAVFIVSGTMNYGNNLIPLFISQVVDCVENFGKKNKYLNILLDEFDSMVPIKDFARIIEYCRSIRVKFTVAIRSYIHLSNMYSKEDVEILKMCFGNLIYLLSDDIYTLEDISKYCGMTEEKGKIVPLISVEELKTFKMFEALILMTRMMPYKVELLPDYKIDYGYELSSCELEERKNLDIHVFKMD